MKPLNRLSVKWVLFLLLCLKAIKHGTCKKSCCNTSYVQASWVVCLVAWSGNNQDLCLCLWFPSLAFLWHIKSWTLYLCMGFDCGWCMSASIITLTKKNRSVIISKMITHANSLCYKWLSQSLLQVLTVCNIIAIPAIRTFVEGYVIDLVWCHHNQNHSVC
jgi:hypothetical protein